MEPPAGRLAWKYLLPTERITRRLDTLEVHSARRGTRVIEIDVSVPSGGRERSWRGPAQRCFLPVVFLTKDPVAPDLEVRDGSGAQLWVPTKAENMELTVAALKEAGSRLLTVGDGGSEPAIDPTVMSLIGDVIRFPFLKARVCSLAVADRLEEREGAQWLLSLVGKLESSYLLWIPVADVPGAEHHLSVRRSAVREPNPVFPRVRGKTKGFTVETSSGEEIAAEWRPPARGVRGIDPAAAVGRALVAFGLMPVKIEEEGVDAERFASYHGCIEPPKGLLLREVSVGEVTKSHWSAKKVSIEEIQTDEEGSQTVQGEDTKSAHVHLARVLNPARVYSRVMIGMRPGTTTLWAVVSVLTCLLLGAFHHNIDELSPHSHRHSKVVCDTGTWVAFDSDCVPRSGFVASGSAAVAQPRAKAAPARNEDRHRINLAIAVAVLLVGPTVASVWALRENDQALLRSMLSGTRMLLLGSAVLSAATALALANVTPFGWSMGRAVGWYASLSYTIAVVMMIGWVQARAPTWWIYRHVLTKTRWNLVATISLAAFAAVAIKKLPSAPLYCQIALFLAGFGFTAVAGNRRAAPLGKVSRVPALLAGIGAIVTLAVASREFFFYNDLFDLGPLHSAGFWLEVIVGFVALVVLPIRFADRKYREAKIEEFAEDHPSPQPQAPYSVSKSAQTNFS